MPANPIMQQNTETQSNYVLVLPLKVIKQQILSAIDTACSRSSCESHTALLTNTHTYTLLFNHYLILHPITIMTFLNNAFTVQAAKNINIIIYIVIVRGKTCISTFGDFNALQLKSMCRICIFLTDNSYSWFGFKKTVYKENEGLKSTDCTILKHFQQTNVILMYTISII